METYTVTKRDGREEEFDIRKIVSAISRAFDAAGREFDAWIIELAAIRVTADYEDKIRENRIAAEDIWASVEKTLSETGYPDVAKAYIQFRRQYGKAVTLKSA